MKFQPFKIAQKEFLKPYTKYYSILFLIPELNFLFYNFSKYKFLTP